MSFVKINVKPDTLDDENRKFVQQSLRQPLFLNSVPKSGSHLLRNIVRMFVPVEDQYQAEFIQHHFLQRHLAAFERSRNRLSWGHLFYLEPSRVALEGVRHILLVRDPYEWVLARARFVLSDEFQAPGLEHLKLPGVGVESILNLMIEGTRPQLAPLDITYYFNAVAWLGTGAHLIRYEELIRALGDLQSDDAGSYFGALFAACGIERPDDWRERVRIGSDRRQSGTARENLSGVAARIPSELPEEQRALVDRIAPGLRSTLGYA
jgi:hypothetical protein